ncbi:hypothetical protein [Streptomyces sp. SID4985]|uniref:hypothetical protein n=1 Tax=unclassified Streptomyces TaxID=2593676 RepID=UPI001367AAA4|nr:hypothetical protein [Streptomyces sp. SID4985]MYQ45452.1 hypothetical protein [Streptomyces sp. SID4985]
MHGDEKIRTKRRAALLIGTAVLASTLAAPTAFADGPSEIYLGQRSGTMRIGGLPGSYKWVDKQYRSTSLSNLRKHSIRITYSGCANWWARAAVKRGSTYDTDKKSAKGCKKSVLLSPMGDLKASVTLTIHRDPTDISGSVVIKPVK